jgi:hypothetical protein
MMARGASRLSPSQAEAQAEQGCSSRCPSVTLPLALAARLHRDRGRRAHTPAAGGYWQPCPECGHWQLGVTPGSTRGGPWRAGKPSRGLTLRSDAARPAGRQRPRRHSVATPPGPPAAGVGPASRWPGVTATPRNLGAAEVSAAWATVSWAHFMFLCPCARDRAPTVTPPKARARPRLTCTRDPG